MAHKITRRSVQI